MIQIKNRSTGEVIKEIDLADLCGADLSRAMRKNAVAAAIVENHPLAEYQKDE